MPKNRELITAALVPLLRQSPRLDARQLQALLKQSFPGITKTHVNRALYGSGHLFWNDGDLPPRWTLLGGALDSPKLVALVEPPNEAPLFAEPATPPTAVGLPDLFDWQREALDAWGAAGRKGIVEAVTGAGKTTVGLAAVQECLEDGGQTVIVVPGIDLQRQWAGLVEDRLGVPVALLGGGHRSVPDAWRVLVAVVNSLAPRKFEVPRNSLLLADECHRYGSPQYSRALSDGFDRRLGLTATYDPSDEGSANVIEPYFRRVCYRIGFERAISDGVVARFKLALLGVRFTPDEFAKYEELTGQMNRSRRWLVSNGHAPAEPYGDFMSAVSQLVTEDWQSKEGRYARIYQRSSADRRMLLNETPAKSQSLADLGDALHGAERSIIFTQSIDAARSAAEVARAQGVAAASIDSALKRQERCDLLSSFAEGAVKCLAAPQILDEGVDVPAADVAVILGASKSRRQMIQRMGRVLRRKDDGRLARFVYVYVEGTTEDPRGGAHADFLDEAEAVADDVRVFPPGTTRRELAEYLCPG